MVYLADREDMEDMVDNDKVYNYMVYNCMVYGKKTCILHMVVVIRVATWWHDLQDDH